MRRGPRAVLALLLVGLVALSGCSEAASARSKEKIPLRIGVLEKLDITADPAVAVDAQSQGFAYNVFQRLMTVEAGTGFLKPDAAAECLFIDEITYSCTLQTNLRFTNGNRLTATDVKFSIERARKLARPGTAGAFLDTLADIKIVDEGRVDFKLEHPDNQFGHILASANASIVDEESYSAATVRSNSLPAIGSGPLQVTGHSATELGYWSNSDYRGRNPAQTISQVITVYDSPAALAAAAENGDLDVVWDAASLDTMPATFHEDRFAGGQVQWLRWNPKSPQRAESSTREYVRDAVQPMRSLRSILPPGTDTAIPVFDSGLREPRTPGQIDLTLWASELPDQQALAEQVRELLESDSAVTVTITDDRMKADLFVEHPSPWVRTPLAWYQFWLDDPLPGTKERNAKAVTELRRGLTKPEKQAASTQLQQWVHDDATIVPLTVDDQRVYLGPTIELDRENDMENWMAPGYQLGVWGFSL